MGLINQLIIYLGFPDSSFVKKYEYLTFIKVSILPFTYNPKFVYPDRMRS